MLSTLVHIKDKNELKIIVPFVFHFKRILGLNQSGRFFEQLENFLKWETWPQTCSPSCLPL